MIEQAFSILLKIVQFRFMALKMVELIKGNLFFLEKMNWLVNKIQKLLICDIVTRNKVLHVSETKQLSTKEKEETKLWVICRDGELYAAMKNTYGYVLLILL